MADDRFNRGYGATCPACGAPDNSLGSLCPNCGHNLVGLKYSVDAYAGDDHSEPVTATDYVFDTYEDASWYAEEQLTALWHSGERCIVATITSDEFQDDGCTPIVEDDVTPPSDWRHAA